MSGTKVDRPVSPPKKKVLLVLVRKCSRSLRSTRISIVCIISFLKTI